MIIDIFNIYNVNCSKDNLRQYFIDDLETGNKSKQKMDNNSSELGKNQEQKS